MKISQKEDFAIILMTVLAQNHSGKFLPLTYIAAKTNLSPLFLKHIAVRLKNFGLIQSKEGVRGGYRLSRHPKQISALDILRAVGDTSLKLSCTTGKCRLDKKSCVCFSFWGKFNFQVSLMLNKVKLNKIAKL